MPDIAVILLADDDERDVELIRRALRECNLVNPLHVVHDGEEAISYLKGEGIYANRAEYPLPELLLLDLKMPRRDGFDVLRWVRRDPGLRNLRIIVLTGSERMSDVNLAYQLGANSFLVKPGDFGQLVKIVQALGGYWLWMSQAPEVTRPAPKGRNERRNGPTPSSGSGGI